MAVARGGCRVRPGAGHGDRHGANVEHAGPATGAGDPRAADHNGHDARDRKHTACRGSHAGSAAEGGVSRRRYGGCGSARQSAKPGGAVPGRKGLGPEAGHVHLPLGCRRGQALGLDDGSVSAHGERRLLLRARHAGCEGRGCGAGDQPVAVEAFGVYPEAGHHCGADGG